MIRRLKYHLGESAAYAGLRISVDPVEMPAPILIHPRRNLANFLVLKQELKEDETSLRVELTIHMRQVPPTHQVRILRIIRKSELGYRVMIRAMEISGAPNGHIFWIDEPPLRYIGAK